MSYHCTLTEIRLVAFKFASIVLVLLREMPFKMLLNVHKEKLLCTFKEKVLCTVKVFQVIEGRLCIIY